MDSPRSHYNCRNGDWQNWHVKQLWEASLEGDFYASPVYANGLLYRQQSSTLYIVDAKRRQNPGQQRLPFETKGVPYTGSPTDAATISSSTISPARRW